MRTKAKTIIYTIFFQAFQDTMLAVQNVINAAESMGLGIVPLGTVNDDPKARLKVLDLPELTYQD